ncbi:histidine kinase dimerization/phosphoacceptor domain-containing protein [Saccharothrix yanglingensis]|uniref:histidine kinase dimerization/phosphoacceptor domain-containing protein n=1 Tax=Saccharothrix yanglingensis TaxID=659496 RepID=UPI0027D2C2C9|nr:histidine kinase dimerization/phosphoacceptor domain-containing protein [Saccharothrix yanglingensis]
MIRTLLQVVPLRDRTRVFADFRHRRSAWAAVVLYGLVVATAQSVEYASNNDPDGWWPLLFALVGGTFALMLRSTLAAWRLATAGLVATRLLLDSEPAILGPTSWCWYIPVMLAVGMIHSGRVVVAVGLLTSAAVFLAGALGDLDHFPATIGTLLILLLLGYAFGARGRAEQRFHDERDAKAALEERARIAREMHDVVAHHMSMVVVRCETAPCRLPGLPDGARREFAELGEAARAAITDMQRLLGCCGPPGRAPTACPSPVWPTSGRCTPTPSWPTPRCRARWG